MVVILHAPGSNIDLYRRVGKVATKPDVSRTCRFEFHIINSCINFQNNQDNGFRILV